MNDISFGAIGAALIAAVVTVVGLVLGKEQKTSEFRQAWVDSLRGEISTYLSCLADISNKLTITYADHAKKLEALSDSYKILNGASFTIKLRLNPGEEKSKAVLSEMARFEAMARDDNALTDRNVDDLEDSLLLHAQALLKYEWNRVKKGEFWYRFAKFSAIAIAGFLLVAVVILPIFRSSVPHDKDVVRVNMCIGRRCGGGSTAVATPITPDPAPGGNRADPTHKDPVSPQAR